MPPNTFEQLMQQGIVPAAACWLLALLVYLVGYRRAAARYEAIAEVPTIRCRDVPGLGAAMVEVKGAAVADQPLVSDLARVPCVAFDSSVTEHWTTTRTERDSKGNTRTVTEHHTATRYSNSGRTPFRVQDDSGAVTVRPEGASIDLLDSMADLDEPLLDSPAYGISAQHCGGYLSYSESVLPQGQTVYVLGQVDQDHAIAKPEVVKRPFIISWRSEEKLLNSARWGRRLWGGFLVLLLAAGFVVLAIAQGT